MLFSVLIIFLSINVVISLERCEIDDPCPTVDGICRTVKKQRECDEFMALPRSRQARYPRCGFIGSDALTCCPTTCPLLVQTRFSRKSVDECNKFGKKPEVLIGTRITNGKISYVGEFPHFAALGYQTDEKISFDCGGVLISEKFVLTAAHCCKKSRKLKIVRLGKTAVDLNDDDDLGEHKDIEVKTVIRHPSYIANAKYHDIALLKLKNSVNFASNIWPACLYPENDFETKNLIIAGFGRTDRLDATKKSDWLLKAHVTEVPLQECREIFKKSYKGAPLQGLSRGIPDEVICASNSETNADTCEGDSGSALKFVDDEVYYVVGITSFGVSCNTSLPAFYTRVYNYLDWIEEIVWK